MPTCQPKPYSSSPGSGTPMFKPVTAPKLLGSVASLMPLNASNPAKPTMPYGEQSRRNPGGSSTSRSRTIARNHTPMDNKRSKPIALVPRLFQYRLGLPTGRYRKSGSNPRPVRAQLGMQQ